MVEGLHGAGCALRRADLASLELFKGHWDRLDIAQDGFGVAELILGDNGEVCEGLLGTMEETLSSGSILGDAGVF